MMKKKQKKITKRPTIGVIGQGWVGKHLAQEFENRGFVVVKYALGARYQRNRMRIASCDIVFIAVPTPTTLHGFSFSIVRDVLALAGTGKIVVIKSTILPGTTNALAAAFPDRFIVHAPEFLTEANAAYDVAHPSRNIIGIPRKTHAYRRCAETISSVLPEATETMIVSAGEAELIKYVSNCFLAAKVVLANVFYDSALCMGLTWTSIQSALALDPRIGPSHLTPVDKNGGRGAGGHCLIKDFAAFRLWCEEKHVEERSVAVLRTIEEKNIAILRKSKKDLSLLKGVYGA